MVCLKRGGKKREKREKKFLFDGDWEGRGKSNRGLSRYELHCIAARYYSKRSRSEGQDRQTQLRLDRHPRHITSRQLKSIRGNWPLIPAC